jgi:drug/metabolite transporter (DMT)-like permease
MPHPTKLPLSDPPPGYWFPAKSYGWGWGPPVKWQGWFVLIGFFGLQAFGIWHFKAQRNVGGLFIYLAVVTALLIVVVYIKGERPTKWRWGRE